MPNAPFDEIDVLIAEMSLGEAVDEFFTTAPGRYVLGRARQEGDEVLADLRNVDAEDSRAVRELQKRLYKLESVVWLNEALVQGRDSEEILKGQHDMHDDEEIEPEAG